MALQPSLQRPLQREFSFAGFDFPRYVGMLPRGSMQKRLQDARKRFTGPYYHAPRPNGQESSFYLESDFMPGLRWKWCDDVSGARIDHTGWYSDRHGVGETIRGLVMTLPHGRGFLAGWSMGEGMIGGVNHHVYDDEASAAYAADSIAERIAEINREDAERMADMEEECA